MRRVPWILAFLTLLSAPLRVATASAATANVLSVGDPLQVGVPLGFVGLAFETQHLGDVVDDPAVSTLPSYLEQMGTGTIRFGGSSVDRSSIFEKNPSSPVPRWARHVITPASLATVASLSAATGWKVALTVNLYHFDPKRAAAEVATARSLLHHSLVEVAIGNEPELYTYMYAHPVSYSTYLATWAATRRAIHAKVPGVAIGGPDFYLPSWFSAYSSSNRAGLGSLASFDQHFYPFSDCGHHGVTPTQLLSTSAIAREDELIKKSRSLADLVGIPTSFDEFNSVSCGSSTPVQHEQASALWGVHALLEAARRGLSSVDVQTNLENCESYTPLCIAPQTDQTVITTQPLWRAMQLVADLEGSTFHQLTGTLPTGVSAYALSKGSATSVIVTNGSDTDVSNLAIDGLGTAHVSSIETIGTSDIESSSDPGLVVTPSTGAPVGLDVPAGTSREFTLSQSGS